jgi:hypothetical protein
VRAVRRGGRRGGRNPPRSSRDLGAARAVAVDARRPSQALRHPQLGELELHQVTLPVADDLEQKLVTFVGLSADEARVAELIAG